MKKYFKGKEYEIVNEIDFCYEYIENDGTTSYMRKEVFSDTKEESLANWKIFALYEANMFHDIKFGKQDKELCVKKLYEETVELFHELEAYLEAPEELKDEIIKRISDEYGDVIQSGLGIFSLKDVLEDNFKKVGPRFYPDNFKHKEIENENN